MFSAAAKPSATVGLDIETATVAATEVRGSGSNARVTRTAIAPLEPGIVSEGEIQDPAALSRALKVLFAKNKLGKAVRLGVANQRIVVRTLRLPLIEDAEELDTAVRFQAQDQIPMPLDQAVLDHQVLTKHGAEGERQMDVLAVAARREMVSGLISAMREAGLEPVGIDVSAFGMIRALNGGNAAPEITTLYCHLGDVTNIAVARGDTCLFTRIAPFGVEPIAARLAERERMTLDDAREWMLDAGLEERLDDFGPEREKATAVRAVLEEGADKLIDEVRLSLDFYSAQEGASPIERVVVCGPGAVIEGLDERFERGLNLAIEVEMPPALGDLNEEDAARLTISYGLALEN
jgi:type IV pilus assembly protein PilM